MIYSLLGKNNTLIVLLDEFFIELIIQLFQSQVTREFLSDFKLFGTFWQDVGIVRLYIQTSIKQVTSTENFIRFKMW